MRLHPTTCHPEYGEEPWRLPASIARGVQARTKVPRHARDDKRGFSVCAYCACSFTSRKDSSGRRAQARYWSWLPCRSRPIFSRPANETKEREAHPRGTAIGKNSGILSSSGPPQVYDLDSLEHRKPLPKTQNLNKTHRKISIRKIRRIGVVSVVSVKTATI